MAEKKKEVDVSKVGIQLARGEGKPQDFKFEHALALLRLQAKKGKGDWVIKTEGWKFVENEIIKR